jgi:hypothetical protein
MTIAAARAGARGIAESGGPARETVPGEVTVSGERASRTQDGSHWHLAVDCGADPFRLVLAWPGAGKVTTTSDRKEQT